MRLDSEWCQVAVSGVKWQWMVSSGSIYWRVELKIKKVPAGGKMTTPAGQGSLAGSSQRVFNGVKCIKSDKILTLQA